MSKHVTYKTYCRRMAYQAAKTGTMREVFFWLREWLTAPKGTWLDAPTAPGCPEAEVNTWCVDEVEA